ncbi:MAG: TetR/AcrR family transcriptional regulator [Solirubrobacteraceae bacterium]|nr:TetR/AcrR family transcriptional regulator [Solirubrobacteraceae bacterium]
MTEATETDGRKLRYAHRREELLAAASVYVMEHGVGTLSMRPLAKALDVAPSALVHHFGTKEQLVTQILGYIRDRSIIPADGATSEDFEAYRTWWYRWDDDALPVLRLAYEVIGLAVRSPERFPEFRAHVISDWMRIVGADLRAAGCPADEVDATATSLVAHMGGLQLDLLITGDRDRVNAAHEQFVGMLQERRRTWVAPGR